MDGCTYFKYCYCLGVNNPKLIWEALSEVWREGQLKSHLLITAGSKAYVFHFNKNMSNNVIQSVSTKYSQVIILASAFYSAHNHYSLQ